MYVHWLASVIHRLSIMYICVFPSVWCFCQRPDFDLCDGGPTGQTILCCCGSDCPRRPTLCHEVARKGIWRISAGDETCKTSSFPLNYVKHTTWPYDSCVGTPCQVCWTVDLIIRLSGMKLFQSGLTQGMVHTYMYIMRRKAVLTLVRNCEQCAWNTVCERCRQLSYVSSVNIHGLGLGLCLPWTSTPLVGLCTSGTLSSNLWVLIQSHRSDVDRSVRIIKCIASMRLRT